MRARATVRAARANACARAAWCAVLLGVMLAGCARSPVWRDGDGHAIRETRERRSARGFGGWLLATRDTDWVAKLRPSSGVAPNFREARVVERRERITFLTFFTNPGVAGGRADVTCDLEVRRPDGKVSASEFEAEAFQGTLGADPHGLFLSNRVSEFTGVLGDPSGEWRVRVTLHDRIRRVDLPLETRFVLR